MEDFYKWGFFILVGGLAIAVQLIRRRRAAQLLERLAELARRKGLEFEVRPERGVDCVLRGRDSGIPWELRYAVGVGQDRGGSYAVFRSNSVTWPETVLLFPKSDPLPIDPQVVNLGALEGIVGKLISHSLSGIGLNLSDFRIVEVGNHAFEAAYFVFGEESESARRLVGAVEAELLRWPPAPSGDNRPVVIMDAEGIKLRAVRGATAGDYQVEIVDRMIRLGLSALRAFL